MTGPAWRLLCVGVAWPMANGGFEITHVEQTDDALKHLAREPAVDAVVIDGDSSDHRDLDLSVFGGLACIVVVGDVDAAGSDARDGAWLARGADDVLGRDELAAAPSSCARRLRFAIERRRRDTGRALAYSTDPATGLPHRQQLVEHLSQMLALREREPSPMAVIVLRIEGAPADDATAEPLRRKLAVRLRAGVRASDVVAAVDTDTFAVLLGAILAPGDAERVAAKLAQSLMAPIPIGGGERAIAVALGIGRYPQDGSDAERLLRRAVSLAAVAPAEGRAGPATVVDAAGAARVAANDDGA